MRFHLLSAACAALALAACGGGGSSEPAPTPAPVLAPAADYYPLGAGDRWLYGDDTVRVCGVRSAGGQMATVLRSFDAGGALQDESLFVNGADGVLEVVADDAAPFARAVGPLRQMAWPVVVGSAFTQVDKIVDSGLDVDGDGRTEPMKVQSVVVVQGLEAVDVPAGRFEGCVHLRTLLTQTLLVGPLGTPSVTVGTGDEWFAPGIGIVKGEYLLVQPDQMLAGQRALTGFAVGGRRTDASTPAVVALWPPDGSMQGPELVVWADFNEAMDIVSLREGAFVVRDASGSVVPGGLGTRGLRVHFVPAGPWAAGRYTVQIGRSATDRVGNPMAAERVWSFSVDPGLNPNPANTLRFEPRPAPAPPTSAR